MQIKRSEDAGCEPSLGPGLRTDLAAVWFLHHEHLAPGQDACGLPLTAASPGEAGQRLLLPADPRTRRLDGDKKRVERLYQ